MPNPAPKARPLLVADGWDKRTGDFYTRPLAPGVLGLLALAPDRGLPHQWRLKPYVGVVHERVDGPEAQERDRWLIAAQALDGNERVFREVAAAARGVGLPWMQRRTSLEAMIYELQDDNVTGRRTPHLTAALWMKGDVAAAEARLADIASRFGAPAPEIPKPLRGVRGVRVVSFGSTAAPEGWARPDFDAFAARLREGMAQHPNGPPEGWSPHPA